MMMPSTSSSLLYFSFKITQKKEGMKCEYFHSLSVPAEEKRREGNKIRYLMVFRTEKKKSGKPYRNLKPTTQDCKHFFPTIHPHDYALNLFSFWLLRLVLPLIFSFKNINSIARFFLVCLLYSKEFYGSQKDLYEASHAQQLNDI
ncbi:CLUMA_CG000811, isoform A [Clunio marinus]|uniref:CLUMA_CG000811, isoform A n=1 Tax=Clunio marinus TaxID=568069 RepID=A0A1J1HKK7_9DIPT|nr:CLUMA_CG000811, isoform A [Clunio marinus]